MPVQAVAISSSCGKRRWSDCCDVGMEFIEQAEVYEALPRALVEVAIAAERAKRDDIERREREMIASFKRSREVSNG
jgi:hypothetical protein